jgi:hypothetical protein
MNLRLKMQACPWQACIFYSVIRYSLIDKYALRENSVKQNIYCLLQEKECNHGPTVLWRQ